MRVFGTFLMLVLMFGNWLGAWEMRGVRGDSDLSTLGSDTVIWSYEDGFWRCTKEIEGVEKLTLLKGGSAYWINGSDSLADVSAKDGYVWREGWNFVSPVFGQWSFGEKFRDRVAFGWRYEDGEWKLYSQKEGNFGYPYFDSLSIGEGAWVYLPSVDMMMNSSPIFCSDGNCSKVTTTDTSYKIAIKSNDIDKDIKIGFDLYRYSNGLHYKFAFGPFKLRSSGVATSSIATCVEKEGVGTSCKMIDNTKDTFVTYSNGMIEIDSQKIAEIFGKSIPSTKESFKISVYVSGVDNAIFAPAEEFGTLGTENFGTWVSIKDDKKVEFEMEIK